jgi:hypothetical protein
MFDMLDKARAFKETNADLEESQQRLKLEVLRVSFVKERSSIVKAARAKGVIAKHANCSPGDLRLAP